MLTAARAERSSAQRRGAPAADGARAVPAGGGRRLEPAVQADMEWAFAHDFSRVRVHTGPEATALAQRQEARAYTVGQQIVVGEASYASRTRAGALLLAHELAHVVQQSRGGGGTSAGDEHERAADAAAAAVLAGGEVDAGPAATPAMQRQTAPSAPVREPDAAAQDPASVTARIEAELAEVQPLASRLVANVTVEPRDVVLNVARGLARRLAQDEQVIGDLAAQAAPPPGAASALLRVRVIRANVDAAVSAAERWHADNPAGESLG